MCTDLCTDLTGHSPGLDLPAEWETSVLDGDGWDVLNRLADRLARHVSFEHHDRRSLHDALVTGVRRYKTLGARNGLDNKQFAAEFLDSLAQEPMRRTLYLGVEHLKLPHGTTVGDVRFLLPSQEQALAQSFALGGLYKIYLFRSVARPHRPGGTRSRIARPGPGFGARR